MSSIVYRIFFLRHANGRRSPNCLHELWKFFFHLVFNVRKVFHLAKKFFSSLKLSCWERWRVKNCSVSLIVSQWIQIKKEREHVKCRVNSSRTLPFLIDVSICSVKSFNLSETMIKHSFNTSCSQRKPDNLLLKPDIRWWKPYGHQRTGIMA